MSSDHTTNAQPDPANAMSIFTGLFRPLAFLLEAEQAHPREVLSLLEGLCRGRLRLSYRRRLPAALKSSRCA
jgi:hypothetical protein